jgi:hypothetical protein
MPAGKVAAVFVITGVLLACPGVTGTGQAAPEKRPCSTLQLRIRESSSQGAAGTWLVAISYRNVSKAACREYGYPGVTLYGPGGQRLPKVRWAPRSYSRPRSIILRPGHRVYGVISYPDRGHRCRRVAATRIYPPNSRRSKHIRLRRADGACGKRWLLAYPLASSAKKSLRG